MDQMQKNNKNKKAMGRNIKTTNRIKAEELLKKHLSKKNLTNEHIHIAAFMSCIDAINEALDMQSVNNLREMLIGYSKFLGLAKYEHTQSLVNDDIDEYLANLQQPHQTNNKITQ